jgi:Protein of unknown function (DUF1524)
VCAQAVYARVALSCVLVVSMLASCQLSTPAADGARTVIPTESPRPATPLPEAPIGSPNAALTALRALHVVPERPNRPGYQRACGAGEGCSFGAAWTDDNNAAGGHNGCGTRDDVLTHQLTDVRLRDGSRCVVEQGVLRDPYTGAVIQFRKSDADAVEIDHVVALALAWDLGAADWTQQQRTDFANDQTLELLAVDRASNRAKSDDGPGQWMPSNRGYWCSYDQRFATILAHYHLDVTAADKAAMSAVLSHC